MKFYVGAMITRNIREYAPGEESKMISVGSIVDVSWHTCNSIRNSFTIEEVEKHMPRWKKYYDASLPKGYRIILEPILEGEE